MPAAVVRQQPPSPSVQRPWWLSDAMPAASQRPIWSAAVVAVPTILDNLPDNVVRQQPPSPFGGRLCNLNCIPAAVGPQQPPSGLASATMVAVPTILDTLPANVVRQQPLSPFGGRL